MAENLYESAKLLSEYLLLHFGGEEEVLDGKPGPREALDFPGRCVRDLLDSVAQDARALDIGCAVGRSSFELAKHCEEVVGIDFSANFIRAAQHLSEHGSMDYERPIEGDLTDRKTAVVAKHKNVSFEVGDAMNLRPEFADFDIVLAANLICRLPEPMKFFDRVPSLVKPGGQLLLTTPFTWLEDFTPREHWLGGRQGEGVRSLDRLKEILAPHFALELEKDLPFLIREHARKFQYGVALGTRWRRR